MLIEKEGIIVVVATKNRNELLKRALESVSRQTKKPLDVFVVSDSDENVAFLDKNVAEMHNFSFLKNINTRNYAGNLNTAIEHIVCKYLYDSQHDAKKLYIAFLDDDDYWNPQYLRECFDNRIPNNDVIVTGINYHQFNKIIPLSIPKKILINSFLEGNPHIQGSNTFLKLSLILEAGCFDENMDSTTDRDLFTRVFMLKPKVAIVNKHLVEVDASNNRNRLTNDKKGKKKSLEQFYLKYGGLMSKQIKEKFFLRAKTFGINLNDDKTRKAFASKQKPHTRVIRNESFKENKKVCFAFVTTDTNYFKRIVQEIIDLDYPFKKIICFLNLAEDKKIDSIKNIVNESNIDLFLLTLKEAKLKAKEGLYGKFVQDNFPTIGNIKDISVARNILQLESYEQTNENEIIYVIDEDIRFYSLIKKEEGFVKINFDLKDFINRYDGKVDAVIGNYSGDAPVPALSTLRTSLLDYVFAKVLNKNDLYNDEAYYADDYYYSCSDKGHKYNETPLPLIIDSSLNELLGGKALSRPLFEKDVEDFVPTRRGGNTLIFNRELLLVPNYSFKIRDLTTRRGDSLWLYLAKKKGFKIIGSTLSLYQDRIEYKFDLKKELKKEFEDILGYASINAIYKHDLTSRSLFYEEFTRATKERTIRFCIDLFRIIGLLKILKNKSFNNSINEIMIYDFIRRIKELVNISFVEACFEEYRSYLNLENGRKKIDKVKSFLIDKLKCKNPILLGYGQEGAVFVDKQKTYKVFYNKDGLDFLKFKIKSMQNLRYLPKNVVFNDELEYSYCYYDSFKNSKPYNKGHAKEFAILLKELRKCGVTISNLKKDNFLISNGSVYYIDIGRGIIPFNKIDYDKAVERCYQLIQYHNLNRHDFKILISKTYHDDKKGINHNLNVFKDLIKGKTKEDTHDPIILELIEKYDPLNILDYGAGKCKIVNTIAKKYDVYVYDVDTDLLYRRADKNVSILNSHDLIKYNEFFDMVICNKVLCCINKEDNEQVLENIEKVLIDNGRLILSICNPFFEKINETVTRTSGYYGKYENSNKYAKQTIYGERIEYHRPFNYYERLLQKYGFRIVNIYEDEGIDVSTLNYVGDHLILDCIKCKKNVLQDCSLMIKTNAMDAEIIYDSVKHIVSFLEKNDSFFERYIVVDTYQKNRVRRFADDNLEKLKIELERLRQDNYVDRIIYLDLPNDYEILVKYFSIKDSKATHSTNGQNILATLKGFECCKTRYIFQTDSDILYFNNELIDLDSALNELKDNDAVTLSLSIAKQNDDMSYSGSRTEARACFLDLNKIRAKLPLTNEINENKLSLSRHKSLDESLYPNESLRMVSKNIFFIHPENSIKEDANLLNMIRTQVELCNIPFVQYEHVNCAVDKSWYPKTRKVIVIFIRGRNTSINRLKRLFKSLKEQSLNNYEVVYFDDASDNYECSEYVDLLSKYDTYFKERLIYIKNKKRIGALANFEIFFKQICTNPKTIIINIDSDDALIDKNAILKIYDKFNNGADLTIGNCFRIDKPLKNYKLVSFKKAWERDGDNIWLHPKCFRRYLCEYIQDNLKKDGKYLEVKTDYAMMLPIIQHCQNPQFIEDKIYLYDASFESLDRSKPKNRKKQHILHNWLLNKAKEKNEIKKVAIIGDSFVDENSYEYKISFEIGKILTDYGYNIQNGGMGGVMEASFKGAHYSKNYRKGSTIAIIPSLNKEDANIYADIIIPTGLDMLRNALVVDADAVIAIGGGAGTLSEIAFAWRKNKLIIAVSSVKGWGEKIADTILDDRKRYPDSYEDKIYSVERPEEIITILKNKLPLYIKQFHGIRRRK